MKSTISKCCYRPIEQGLLQDTTTCTCCGNPCKTLHLYICRVCKIVSDRESTICTPCEEMAARKEVSTHEPIHV